MIDQTETDILAGAVTALRRRAAREREIAASGRPSEAATAARIAAVLADLANEFEREAAPPCLPA
jgi:hypothetical protein